MLSLQRNWWVQTWVIYNVQWTVSQQSNNYYPAQATVRMLLLSWLFCLPGWACKSIWRDSCSWLHVLNASVLSGCKSGLQVFTLSWEWLTVHDCSVNNTNDNSNDDKCILYQFARCFELQYFFFYILKGTFVLQPEVHECRLEIECQWGQPLIHNIIRAYGFILCGNHQN